MSSNAKDGPEVEAEEIEIGEEDVAEEDRQRKLHNSSRAH